MFIYYHQQRVNYSETDQMGYVYYANYGYYYEQARAEAIRFLGVSYKDIESAGIITPVTRMSVKYIQPAHYDELLTIKTSFPDMPGRMLTIEYKIYNEKNKLINEAHTQMAFADVKSKQLVTAPAMLIEKLKPYYLTKTTQKVIGHHVHDYAKTG
jgi:acyl-CoA thioester hydrolase